MGGVDLFYTKRFYVPRSLKRFWLLHTGEVRFTLYEGADRLRGDRASLEEIFTYCKRTVSNVRVCDVSCSYVREIRVQTMSFCFFLHDCVHRPV